MSGPTSALTTSKLRLPADAAGTCRVFGVQDVCHHGVECAVVVGLQHDLHAGLVAGLELLDGGSLLLDFLLQLCGILALLLQLFEL